MPNLGEDDITLGLNVEADKASAERAGDVVGDALAEALSAAIRQAAPQMGKALANALRKHLTPVADAISGAIKNSAAEQAVKGLGDSFKHAKKAADDFADATDRAATGEGKASKRAELLAADMKALTDRAEAFRLSLAKVGADPRLFAQIAATTERVAGNLRDFNADIKRISNDPDLLKAYETEFRSARIFMGKETTLIRQLMQSIEATQRREGNKAQETYSRQLQERLLASKHSYGREITALQGANAQQLVESRIAGQRQIQNERQRSRTRIELVRFTFNQIRTLERGIAGVFRATGTVATSAFRTLEGAAARIGGLFRRTNRDLNDGLRGALLRRESSIDRSFRRQTSDVRRSVAEQSVVLQRFEAQASTGIAGALSGRSRLGALFGGGLAFGGGFAAFQGLRNGFNIGGDFVQGLAVLGAQLELTEEQLAGVRAQSIELGNDISLPGVSALDAASAIQLLAKQFANLGEAALPAAQGAARGVLQLARAAAVDAEEAARVVGAAVNVFRVDANDAVAVADQITNALTKAAGVGFGDFADAFTQSAGVVNLFTGPAAEATTTLAEFNAALAVLAKNGLVGSDAGTSLKQFFLQANRNTVDSRELLAEVAARAGVIGDVFFDASGGARTLGESLDILRRGTKDLNSQQLAATLQKLFGSDAARAAAFLLDETTDSFNRLTAGITKAGSAEAIAAAQNVGLRGAFDALRSVIETQQIKTYEKYQDVLGRVVLRFADLLNQFFAGEGVFAKVRTILVGVAAALGGLLVVKAVAEGFQFLTIALRGALTPLGAFIAIAATLGAAIALLRETSPAFREEFDGFAKALGGRALDAVGLLGDGLAKVAEIARTKVLPVALDMVSALKAGLSGEGVTSNGLTGFLERIGVGLRQVVIAAQAFGAAMSGREFTSVLTDAGFLNEERQTAFVRFAERLGETFSKAREAFDALQFSFRTGNRLVAGSSGESADGIIGFAETVGLKLRAAREAWDAFVAGIRGQDVVVTGLAGFAEQLGVTVSAVVDRIGEISSAVGDLFSTGDGSKLRDLLLGSLRDIGDKAVEVLGPQLKRLSRFIADQLSPDNLERFVLGLANFVFEVGRLLGSIVSDPKVVAALEALVGAIAATAGLAIAGFAKGIADNLPALGAMLRKQIQFVFDEIFKDGINFKKIAGYLVAGLGAAIAAVGLLASLRQSFRSPMEKAGQTAGKTFARSFASSIRTGFTGSRNNPFAAGLFGGTQFLEREAAKTAAAEAKALQRARDRLSVLNVSGPQTQTVRGRNALGQFTGSSSLEFTRPIEDLKKLEERFGKAALAGVEMRNRLVKARTEIGVAFNGLGRVIQGEFRAGFSQAGTAASGAFKQIARTVGVGIRNIRETGIGVGQALGGAIVSGVGAALSGQQLGTADSAGGKALGLAGIISSALFAGASVGGGPQGVLVGSIVLGIGAITTAIAANGEAAELAEERIRSYVDILKQAGSAADAAPALAEGVADALLDQGPAVQALLQQSKFDVRGFTDEVVAGEASVAGAIRRLTSGLNVDQRIVDAFIDTQVRLGSTSAEVLDDLRNAAKGRESTIQAQGLAQAIRDVGADGEAAALILDTLFSQGSTVASAIDQFLARNELLNPTTAATTDAINGAAEATRGWGGRLRDLGTAALDASGKVVDLARDASARGLAANVDNVRIAIATLNQQRTDAITSQIGDLNAELDAARQAADFALQAVLELTAGPGDDPFQQAFDRALQSIPQIGEGIQTALSEGVTAGLDTAAGADLRDLVRQFSAPFREAVAQAIKDPAIGTDPAKLKAAFEPLYDQIRNQTIEVRDVEGNVSTVRLSPEARRLLLAELDEVFTNTGLESLLKGVTLADESVRAITEQIEGLKAELKVRVAFDPQQIQEALREAGLPVLRRTEIFEILRGLGGGTPVAGPRGRGSFIDAQFTDLTSAERATVIAATVAKAIPKLVSMQSADALARLAEQTPEFRPPTGGIIRSSFVELDRTEPNPRLSAAERAALSAAQTAPRLPELDRERRAALTAAQTGARDQAEAAGNLNSSADALERAAEKLEAFANRNQTPTINQFYVAGGATKTAGATTSSVIERLKQMSASGGSAPLPLKLLPLLD